VYSARALADSVKRNLQRMLNTRQAQTPIQPEYGMVDVTDCAESLPEVLDTVRRAIRISIERFEPRLRRVRISPLPSPDSLTLRFAITGDLETGRERVAVSFDTTIDPIRGVAVEGSDP
jgi:type VI secretion system protein